MKRHVLVFGMLLASVHFPLASSQRSSSADEVVRFDIADRDARIIQKVEVAEAAAAVEIRLSIAEPGQLDLDLLIFDSDPTANDYVSPICVSDSVGANEVCAVKRPASGAVWALVTAVGGEGKSPFTLTKSLVNSHRADLVLAQPISPNGSEIQVGPSNEDYQFRLEAGEVAVVVLEVEERSISVEDEEGSNFPVRKTGVGRQQVAIGERFQAKGREEGKEKIDWLLRGVGKSQRYLVKLGPSRNPYGHADTILSVVRPRQKTEYVLAFSVDNLDNEPKVIEGPWRNLTRPATYSPVLFKFIPSRATLMAAEVIPEESYDIAICDEFGFVLSISTRTVLWNAGLESTYQTQGGENKLYFAVFPDPFVFPDVPVGAKFTLLIKSPEER